MIVFYVPIGSAEAARSLARALLEERLVACANLIPMQSLYHWQGGLAEESEVVVLLKTRGDLADAARRRIAELHPYDVPCIAAFTPESVNDAYAAWVRAETAPRT